MSNRHRPDLGRRRALAGLGAGVLSAAAGATAAFAPPAVRASLLPPREPLSQADALLVVKHQRRLHLLRDGAPLRDYRIALGLNPRGHKQREGDFRTPEGHYRIYRRNPRSDFFLSLGISYPDADDLDRARRHGWRPGGAIMIHGLPNMPRRPPEFYATTDWTDGCIALSNEDMLEVWLLVPVDVPIEIRP